jgi:hypothetical protein
MARLFVLVFFIAATAVAAQYLLRPTPVTRTAVASPSFAQSSSAAPSATQIAGVPEACRPYVRGTPFATGSLLDRVGAANSWTDQHPGDAASLILTDAVMQSLADTTRWSVPVEDVRVAIENAGVRLSATAALFGRFTIRALLVPDVSGGRLRIVTRELDTDGLPGFLRPSVEDALASASDVNSWGLRMRVDGAVTQSGCGVVWGHG